MAAARTARAWPWVIALLAIALVAVLAIGSWATWRPLSEYDAARLTARDIVTSVGESPRIEVPLESVDRQLSALGPAASPAQRDRLDEFSDQAPESGTDQGSSARGGQDEVPGDIELRAAATRMFDLVQDQDDPQLATTMAAIAASWSAESTREDPATQPIMRTGEDEAAARDARSEPAETGTAADERCTPELTAVATQLDHSLFTARSADARNTDSGELEKTLDEWQQNLQRIQEDTAVAGLYECEPRPARGGYQLPSVIAEDPAAATAATAQELSEYAAGASGTVAPDERAWLLDVLESSSRAQALLQPSDPVPALAGEPLMSDR